MLWRHPAGPASSCQIGNEIEIGDRNYSMDQYWDVTGFTNSQPALCMIFRPTARLSLGAHLKNFRQLFVVVRNARNVRTGHSYPVVNKKHRLLPKSTLTLTFPNPKFRGKCIVWIVGACYLFVLCTLSACSCYFYSGFN